MIQLYKKMYFIKENPYYFFILYTGYQYYRLIIFLFWQNTNNQ